MAGLFDDYLGAAPDNQLRITVTPRPSLDSRSRELAIRTVLGEAGGESDEGMAGVAAVIKNRVQAGRYGGSDVPRVVTAKGQFEPWGNPEARAGMMAYSPNSEAYQRAGAAVDRVFGEGYDPTGGATHFYSPTAQAALGRPAPAWAQGEPLNIGRHAFYAPEGRVGSTDVSAQARKPAAGLFDDYLSAPASNVSSPPETGPPDTASLPVTGGRFSDTPGQNFRTAREGAAVPVSAGQAFGAHAIQSAMFNFADELMGTMIAGGADFSNPAQLKNFTSLVTGAFKRLTGDKDAETTYNLASQAVRDALDNQRQQRPGAALGGTLTGALATAPFTGGAGVARGAAIGARALAGAKTGAVYGAISGAGEGTDAESRLIQGAKGGALGAAIGAPLGVVLPAGKAAVAAAPSAAELKAAARAGFESAPIKDLEIVPRALGEFGQGLRTKLNEAGIDENLAPKTFGILSKLAAPSDAAAVTGNNIQSLRRTFQMAAGSPDKTERLAASKVIEAIDEFIPNLAAKDILSGNPKAAAEAWATARGNYAAAMRSDEIAKALLKAARQTEAAGSGANIDNATRQQFKAILNSEKRSRGFSDEELAAMETAVRGTTWGNFTRLLGKAAPTGIVSGGLSSGAGFAAGGPVGAVLVPIGGWIAKKLGDRSTANQIAKLDELVRSRAPLSNSMQDMASKAAALETIQSPRTISAAALAARNLSSNLKDAGISMSPTDIMRAIQGGAQKAAAENEQQQQ